MSVPDFQSLMLPI
jgi:restriction system protein